MKELMIWSIGIASVWTLSSCSLRVEFVSVDREWQEQTTAWEKAVKQKMDYYDEEIRKLKEGGTT